MFILFVATFIYLANALYISTYMKRFLVLLSLAGAFALPIVMSSLHNIDLTPEARAASGTQASSLSTLFKESVGKYAFDCGLLSNKTFSSRLKALTGPETYKLMFDSNYVLSPVEYSKGFYHFWGMVKYEDFEFEIAYDPAADVLSICLLDGAAPQYLYEGSKSAHSYW